MSNEISALVANSLETKPSYGYSSSEFANSAKPKIDREGAEKPVITSIAEGKQHLGYDLKKSHNTDEIDNADSIDKRFKQITESVNSLNSMQGRKLMFERSNESGDYVIKVIDKETKDVIRQIPSEEFIRVAEKIRDLSEQLDTAQGLLFDSKA